MWLKYFYFLVFIGLFFSDRDSLLMWYKLFFYFIYLFCFYWLMLMVLFFSDWVGIDGCGIRYFREYFFFKEGYSVCFYDF